MAIKHLKCSSEMRCAVSVTYALDFEDLVEQKHVKYFINNFYIDSMFKL